MDNQNHFTRGPFFYFALRSTHRAILCSLIFKTSHAEPVVDQYFSQIGVDFLVRGAMKDWRKRAGGDRPAFSCSSSIGSITTNRL
jgi:hypothetical protein